MISLRPFIGATATSILLAASSLTPAIAQETIEAEHYQLRVERIAEVAD